MDVKKLFDRALKDCEGLFAALDEREVLHTGRILDVFNKYGVSARHFAPTSGYGYDDIGRDTLESVFAELFGAQAAIVRPQITSGTHALSMTLFGLLRPGDELLSATGKPYDTMDGVIGLTETPGSLKEMGVSFASVPMREGIDTPAVLAALKENTRVVLIQRSRGYDLRKSLITEDMRELIAALKKARPDIFIMVDNCYGEFTRDEEPTHLGADVIVGSLIKNAGGGIAPTGGYIVGSNRAIERIEARLTAPGEGRALGSYAGGYRLFYQGLFLAPHVVCQALKCSILAARLFEILGFEAFPAFDAPRGDIIEAINLKTPERVIAFCQAIQAASPVDSNALPEPWDMPGYSHQVIMAAGAFVSGASIELSADAPMREPYAVYLQGGLTFAHGKIALLRAIEDMDKKGLL